MNHPYYIVAPPYIRTSAGVKVLYRLCHLINKLGGEAFIYQRPHLPFELSSSPSDIAPFLNKRIVDYHYKNGLTPIVIYPETIDISKFNAPFRVRYILNYDNFLFENETVDNDDYLICYSMNILDKLNTIVPSCIINLPISDANFFCPPKVNERKGGAFYAGKYKYFFGGKTLPITNGMIEITRDLKDSQTPEQIRDIFQNVEYFYCYEDTALIMEAMLCNCPVIMIPNQFFQESLGAKELGGLGYAWGYSSEQISHAKNTVHLVRDKYFLLLQESISEIQKFINITQSMVKSKSYHKPFADAYLHMPYVSKFAIIRIALETIEDKGFLSTMKIIYKRLKAGRLKLFS